MFQTYEDCIERPFCIRCEDVGLNCNYTIYGTNEEAVIHDTILHMLDYHAIKPEEITTDMKLKILENICIHYPPPLTSPSFYNSHF